MCRISTNTQRLELIFLHLSLSFSTKPFFPSQMVQSPASTLNVAWRLEAFGYTCVFLPIMLICFSRILLRAMSMATSGVKQWSGGWAAVFDSSFSSAQKWVCIILNHLALLAASKHAMAATIKVAGAKIGLEADIQSIKPNVPLHVAPGMKDFTKISQWKEHWMCFFSLSAIPYPSSVACALANRMHYKPSLEVIQCLQNHSTIPN